MLLPATNRSQGILKPAHQVGVVPASHCLVLSTVAVDAWWDFERNKCHDYTDRLDTNDSVTMADGTDGLVGEVPAGYCSIVTPTSVGRHIIST